MDNRMSYIGRCKKCGAVCYAIADMPDSTWEVANEVSGWITDGMAVERVTDEYVRQNFSRCGCKHINGVSQLSLFEAQGD